MKLKCAVFLYIILILTLTETFVVNATTENEFCRMSRNKEEQCGLYTHKIVKPLLNYIHEMKQKIDNNDILTVQKDNQISELQKTVNQLQQKVSNSVLKEHLIESDLAYYKKIIDELPKKCSVSIKTEIEQLAALKSALFQKQLEIKSATIKEQNIQIIELRKHINDDAIKCKENESQLRNLIDSLRTTIKDRDEIINKLNTQDKKNSNILHETQLKLKECEIKLEKLKPKASSCLSFKDSPGIHQMTVPGIDKFDVVCDSKTAGPGWIVIQQRINGKEDFYRNFTTYQNGFGSFDGDFFLGLEKIHRLTKHKQYQLYIHMEPFDEDSYYASYDHFAISGESDQYRLINADGYSGTAYADYLYYQKYMKFYTFDRDNENNCARKHQGAWWYDSCANSNLNGKYIGYAKDDKTSNYWNGYESLKKVQMLIRPKVN